MYSWTKGKAGKNLTKNGLRIVNANSRRLLCRLLPGDGSPEAEIVFIGERRVKKGRDWQAIRWSSRKILAEMLSAIKLNREDIYITNIVKYRPPNNRDPLRRKSSLPRMAPRRIENNFSQADSISRPARYEHSSLPSRYQKPMANS